jgi:uncharacterized MAPEG superfamily protein
VSAPVVSLLAYVLWTMLLAIAVFMLRTPPVLFRQKKANEFTAGVPHGSDAYWRINRAHMNCTENIGAFAAVVLAAEVTGVHDGMLDLLAVTVMVCRMAQSSVHVASGSEPAVVVRAGLFSVQVICIVMFAIQTIRLA